MSTTGDLSLYFHIPFCRKKCPYCHFYVVPDKENHKELYLKALKQEWHQKKSQIQPFSVTSVYIGGGTPSVFLQAILSILTWTKPYRNQDCEITCEMNPEDVTKEFVTSLKKNGVNRVSLGVQSFTKQDLLHIGREKLDLSIFDFLYEKIPNISIDLMYDIPSQTKDRFIESVELAVLLPIKHISLYNLTIEPHTVFSKTKPKQPCENESLLMLQSAVSTFEKAGFHRYEISAFAKEGYESRHNTRYWMAKPFLGFGPSAFSYIKGKRFRNIPHLLRYEKALRTNTSLMDFEETLSDEEQQSERLAIQLRLTAGVSLVEFQNGNGRLNPSLQKNLQTLIDEGFLEKKSRIFLTEKGKLFYDTAMSMLI